MGTSTRITVGTLTGSLSRSAGGLFESVRGLQIATLAIPGVSVKVFGLRDDHFAEDAAEWMPIAVEPFDVVGPRALGYSPMMISTLVGSGIDVLHLHGIWMYPSMACTRWARATGRPYVISAHGMLDPWAVRHSRWKKRVVEVLYERSNLQGASCLRALCSSEASAMRAFGLTNPICVVPNGIFLPSSTEGVAPPWGCLVPSGARVLLYVGRLHPKKNLDSLLEVWAGKARSAVSAGEWRLVIAGWDQGGHESELKARVAQLGITESVHFVGALFGANKAAAFRNARAFVLPSVSEGLPMAVLEAWAYGLPVLMTAECNLPEGFLRGGAMRLPLDSDGMANTLEQFLVCEDETLEGMGRAGRRLVEEQFTWQKISQDMVTVYEWLLGRAAMPGTVVLA